MMKRLMPMALAIATVLGVANTASAEPYIFAFSGGVLDGAILRINGTTDFSTSSGKLDGTDPFDTENNQGWWSPTAGNNDGNDNYFVGSFDAFDADYHNFFSFDLRQADFGQITSAELIIKRSGAFDTSGGFGTILYTLWDVSTPAGTLNDNEGTSQAIFDDLGSGTTYGSILVDDTGSPDPLVIALNADAITAILRAQGGYFSIGGALPVPEPASLALLLLGGGAAAFRARRRRVS